MKSIVKSTKINSGPSNTEIKKEDIFLLPNILTYIRILLVPVFVVVYLCSKTLSGHIWAIVIVAVSAVTDVADGMIARKFNKISFLGKFLDPIADKLMQFAMMVCILIKYPIVIILAVIFIIKEGQNLFVGSLMLKKGYHLNGSRWYGKLCTVVLYASMLTLIAIPEAPDAVLAVIIPLCSVAMIFAMIMYNIEYCRLYSQYCQDQNNQIKESNQ